MTISLFAMSALATGTRSVSRVDKPGRNTSPGCLVAHKASELGERPGMPLVAIHTPNRCSLSDASQVFKSDCLACTNSLLYQGLANYVVGILLKTFLTSAHLLQAAFGRARTYFLQDLTPLVIACTNSLDLCPTKGLPLTISSQVDDAKINAEGITRFRLFWCILALSDIQVVDTTSPNQVSTADLPGTIYQHIVLASPQDHGADNTTLHRIEGNTIKAHQAKGTSIIANRATWPELWASFTFLSLCGLDSLNCLSTSTDRQLSANPKARTSLTINTVMGCVGIGDVLFPTDRSNPRSSLIETLLRFSQRCLVSIYVKLNTDCSYERFVHKRCVPESRPTVKKGGWQGIECCSTWQFLPRMNAGGFLATSL